MDKELKLTEPDIKLIKYEKRTGYVFAAMILVFGALFNIIYLYGNEIDLNFLFLIDFLVLLVAAIVLRLINRKFVKDLRDNIKIVKIEKVDDKITITDYEPGSGSLTNPVLGALLPGLFKQEMKPFEKYKLTINNYQYDVDEPFFKSTNKGDYVRMFYSKHSKLLLGIEHFGSDK